MIPLEAPGASIRGIASARAQAAEAQAQAQTQTQTQTQAQSSSRWSTDAPPIQTRTPA